MRTTTLNERSRFLAEFPEWHCRECGAVWEGEEEPSEGGFTCDACQEEEEPAEVCRARWEYLNGGMGAPPLGNFGDFHGREEECVGEFLESQKVTA